MIRKAKPDYIFSININNYDEVDYQVLWVIKEASLKVIRSDRNGGELEEYDADFYINAIAPDSFFSASKRWDENLHK